jgi:hypothetical protein
MTNNALTIRPAQELEAMDNTDLLGELQRATAATASNLVYMAQIWKLLEGRGMDMAPFRNGLLRFLPMIASGEVIPEVVIKLAGNMTLLGKVGKLPPERQKALANGEPVPVLDPESGAVRERKIEELGAKEVRQLFGVDGKLRDVEAQRRMVEALKPQSKGKSGLVTLSNIAVNEKAGTIKIGAQLAELDDLRLALKQAGYRVSK